MKENGIVVLERGNHNPASRVSSGCWKVSHKRLPYLKYISMRGAWAQASEVFRIVRHEIEPNGRVRFFYYPKKSYKSLNPLSLFGDKAYFTI